MSNNDETWERQESLMVSTTDYHSACMVVRNVAPCKFKIMLPSGEDIDGCMMYERPLDNVEYDQVVVASGGWREGIVVGSAYIFVCKDRKWGLYAAAYYENRKQSKGEIWADMERVECVFKPKFRSVGEIVNFIRIDLRDYELDDTEGTIADDVELWYKNNEFSFEREKEALHYIRNFYTPERINHLNPNQIFVFGSNLAGMHGGGAARFAATKFGAENGVGVGRTGRCYAIPTMQGGVETIKPYVDDFIQYAAEHTELEFLVTRIGCGIAGFQDSEVAPLFKDAFKYGNIVLPKEFVELIT